MLMNGGGRKLKTRLKIRTKIWSPMHNIAEMKSNYSQAKSQSKK